MNIKYDVAISFAGEDRKIAMEIATSLTSKGITVFYDEFEKANLWGKDLYEHLISIYKDNSKYCLMLLSSSYSKKLWTSHERKAAQARAFTENKEYILPLKLDSTEVPGILGTTGYIDFRDETADSISQLIVKKLWGDLENDKGFELLKVQLEKLYMRIMLICEISFLPTNHEKRGMMNLAPQLFEEGKKMFSKLNSDLQINAPNIDLLIISQITKVMDSFDNILDKAGFLMNLHNPKWNNYYFISEIPEDDFNITYKFLERMNLFENYSLKNKRHFTPKEIIDNWKSAEKECDRFCSTTSGFNHQDNLISMFFDHNTVRIFSDNHLKIGEEIRVYKNIS